MTLLPARTPRFEAFIAPARARPALWRLLAGALLATAAWLASVAALLPLALRLPADPGRAFLLAYLLSFAGLALGTAAAAWLLQRRAPSTLLGPGGFRPRHFALAVAVVALLAALSAPLLAWLATPARQMPLAAWAAWLPLVLPALFLQTAAEEAAFRGYLMQGLAARFRSRWIWLLLPALLFGLLHWNPAEFGANAWIVALSTAVIGLVLADVTVQDRQPLRRHRPPLRQQRELAPPRLPPVAARRLQPLDRPHRPGRHRRRPPAPPRRPRHHARRLGRLARLPAHPPAIAFARARFYLDPRCRSETASGARTG